MKKSQIAVLAGGYSSEHDISLQSAETVMKQLDKAKHEPYLVIVDKSGWYSIIDDVRIEINKIDFSLLVNNVKVLFDAILVVVHGPPGENGEIQSYFDMLDIPYTTSSSFPLALSFNKYSCNCFLKYHGIQCAKSLRIEKNEKVDVDKLVNKIPLPLFVKSNESGSSFGVNFISEKKNIIAALNDSFTHSDDAIVEEYLNGIEVSCGIMRYNGENRILGVTEIVSENDFFDYEAKYNGTTKEITPARLPQDVLDQIEELTIISANLLRLTGLSRIDFIVKDNVPYFLEANSVPGLSSASIIPQQVAYAQWTLKELFSEMINEALRQRG